MANDSESLTSTDIALIGVLLTALTILIGVCNRCNDTSRQEEKELQEAKARQVAELENYNKKIDDFESENYRLSKQHDNCTIAVNNKTNKTLYLAVRYLALNGTWISTGYLKCKPNKQASFAHYTSNRRVYVYLDSFYGNEVLFNTEPISDSMPFHIRSGNDRFTIIGNQTPPFELRKVYYYGAFLTNEMMLTIDEN